MAGDRIRIDELPTTILPSLEHVIAAMKDGESFGLTLEQVLSLYAPPTSPTLDAPTVQNIMTLADAAKLRRWGVSDTAIDALIPGVSQGTILEGAPGRHLTLGVQSGAADTGLYVLDKGNAGNPATADYLNLLLALSRNQFKYQSNDIWHAGNFSKGEELVSSGVITTSTPSLDITLPNTYKSYRLRTQNVKPDVNTTGYFVAQLKAGGSWITGNGQYIWANHYWGSSGSHSIWGSGTFSNAMALVSGQQPANSGLICDIDIMPGGLTGTNVGVVNHRTAVWDGALGGDTGFGVQSATFSRLEAIRLLFSSQNIGYMEWWLWGQK